MNCTSFTPLVLLFIYTIGWAGEADRFANVQVTSQHIGGTVHMLTGAGGNIAVSVGDDGTLIVDDQFAPLAGRIQAAVDELGGSRPKLVLNTHYHGDHTGSNAFFGAAGTIVAHDNVRIRLVNADDVQRVALPLVTFAEGLTVHFNDDEIALIHLPHGHTDGDSAVWFKNANVLHTGDQLFNGRFPFVDIDGGGTVSGYMQNLETILELVPADIRIIPGHGALANVVTVAENLEVIRATQKMVVDALNDGESIETVIERGLGAEYADWASGFINEERWIRILDADRQGATGSRR
ncbi:MAG: MBL fold metallo-hydrolase [Pseudomonadales bacterium]